MTPFDHARAFTLSDAVEGGFSNDPNDPGGPTNHGISLRFALGVGDLDQDGHPDLDVDGDGDVDIDDIRALPKEQAIEVYRLHFWNKLSCDALPAPIAVALFDTAVNMGRGPAVTCLQRALGVEADGRLGPVTRRVALAEPPDLVLKGLLDARLRRYWQLDGFPRFGLGWTRCTLALLHYCLVLSQEGRPL